MDEKERIEVEETEVVETTDVETTADDDMAVTPGSDVDGGEEPVEASGQTEDGKTILEPEDDMDREITNPDGMPAPTDLNVDKQINDENTGFMDELGKKFEAGVLGDVEKEGVHDENVEGIIAEIDKAMQIQHAADNGERDPEDPSHETLGGVDITENRENSAATALQERADANAKTEYTATGEPKELGEYMKEQNQMEDGKDLFGNGNDDHEVVNDKVEVMASTFDNSDSNVEGSVVPEGEAGAVAEDGGNTSELEANGDSENRSFEAGNSLTATEEEDEDFIPSKGDDEEEESDEEAEDDEMEDDYDEEDDDYSDDYSGDAEDMEATEPVDAEGESGSLTVTIQPGTDKEVSSISDMGETTVTAELVTPKGLLDGNKEVTSVNTEDNVDCCGHCDGTCGGDGEVDSEVVEPGDDVDAEETYEEEEDDFEDTEEVEATEDEQPEMPGNYGNDMVEGSNYKDAGDLDEHKDLADIVREMDAFDAGMGIGDDAQNPTQFGDNAVDSEEMGDGQSYDGGDPYDRDACCDSGEEMGATQDTDAEDVTEEPVESDNGEDVAEDEGDYSEGAESVYSRDFSPWSWN